MALALSLGTSALLARLSTLAGIKALSPLTAGAALALLLALGTVLPLAGISPLALALAGIRTVLGALALASALPGSSLLGSLGLLCLCALGGLALGLSGLGGRSRRCLPGFVFLPFTLIVRCCHLFIIFLGFCFGGLNRLWFRRLLLFPLLCLRDTGRRSLRLSGLGGLGNRRSLLVNLRRLRRSDRRLSLPLSRRFFRLGLCLCLRGLGGGFLDFGLLGPRFRLLRLYGFLRLLLDRGGLRLWTGTGGSGRFPGLQLIQAFHLLELGKMAQDQVDFPFLQNGHMFIIVFVKIFSEDVQHIVAGYPHILRYLMHSILVYHQQLSFQDRDSAVSPVWAADNRSACSRREHSFRSKPVSATARIPLRRPIWAAISSMAIPRGITGTDSGRHTYSIFLCDLGDRSAAVNTAFTLPAQTASLTASAPAVSLPALRAKDRAEMIRCFSAAAVRPSMFCCFRRDFAGASACSAF